jgi:hypothetical protein
MQSANGAGGGVLANDVQHARRATARARRRLQLAAHLGAGPLRSLAVRLARPMEQLTPIAAVWHTVQIYSTDDLMAKPMTIGNTRAGCTTSGSPHSRNAILGTKMKCRGLPRLGRGQPRDRRLSRLCGLQQLFTLSLAQ